MIRANDFPAHGQWLRIPSPSPHAAASEVAAWFCDDMDAKPVRIAGDLNLASRGLSAAQHAALVLSQLCGEADGRV
jgi:hypothetical protein